jgi:ABC-type glutathione transport system ATPase component
MPRLLMRRVAGLAVTLPVAAFQAPDGCSFAARVAGRERAGRALSGGEQRRRARDLQAVFQDTYTSLDPRQRVGNCLDEVLRLHTGQGRRARQERVRQLLHQFGLDERHSRSVPRQLSGGQCQRVLNLLADIRAETGVSYVFISHDLAVVRQVTDDLIVMRDGQLLESGRTARVMDAPRHLSLGSCGRRSLARDGHPAASDRHWIPLSRVRGAPFHE